MTAAVRHRLARKGLGHGPALGGRPPITAFALFFAAFPFLLPYHALATQVLIYGLFALGFNLLYGYTGILSFGHAAYYGLGAYGTGLALAKLKVGSLWLGLGIGLATAVLGGVLIGFFCLRRRGIYFAMLTLAFAQMLYFIAFHASDLTGGDDGLRGIPVHAIGLPGGRCSLQHPLAFYFFAYALVLLAVAGLKRILDSPFGAVLQAIRENSDRAVACGYDIDRIKLLSFVFSALFAGLAGGLDALRLTVVPVESLYWSTSGQVVIMTLLGGAGTFFGPFVGAATYLVLADRLSIFIEFWPLVIGVIFMAFVLFLPKGIWGTPSGVRAARGVAARPASATTLRETRARAEQRARRRGEERRRATGPDRRSSRRGARPPRAAGVLLELEVSGWWPASARRSAGPSRTRRSTRSRSCPAARRVEPGVLRQRLREAPGQRGRRRARSPRAG